MINPSGKTKEDMNNWLAREYLVEAQFFLVVAGAFYALAFFAWIIADKKEDRTFAALYWLIAAYGTLRAAFRLIDSHFVSRQNGTHTDE